MIVSQKTKKARKAQITRGFPRVICASNLKDSVTDIFPNVKILRPCLAVFAFCFAKTHTSLRLSNPNKSKIICFLRRYKNTRFPACYLCLR